MLKVRAGEHQIAADAVRDRAPEKIGTELAPAAVRAVGNQAHDRIGKGADEADNRHHPQQCRLWNAPDVHIVVGEQKGEGLEKEVRGRVAQGIADVFARLEAVAGGRFYNGSACIGMEMASDDK